MKHISSLLLTLTAALMTTILLPSCGGTGANKNDAPIALPEIAAPAKGSVTLAVHTPAGTCNGIYAVGTMNAYDATNLDYTFAPLAGQKDWYTLTLPYAPDLSVKVLAIPEEKSEAGWSYQWAPRGSATDPMFPNVVLLQGPAHLLYENGNQPKLDSIADGAVVWVNIKAWAVTPCDEAIVATAVWIKHPWNGDNWTWVEMEPVSEGIFEYRGVWGAAGANLSSDGLDGGVWYPYPSIEDEELPAIGDTVLFTFVSTHGAQGTLSIRLLAHSENRTMPYPYGEKKQRGPIIVRVRPKTWTHVNMYAWTPEGKMLTESWPGTAMKPDPVTRGVYMYTFPADVKSVNVVFNNFDAEGGSQTSDIQELAGNCTFIIEDDCTWHVQ